MKISAEGIVATFDASLGILTGFEASGLAPLHTAPWVGREQMPQDAPPHLAKLGGDFFCAPFGGSEGESSLHGWPPNSPWEAEYHGSSLTATLHRKVQGARLSKEISLIDGHPFVYQRHVFEGGTGSIAVANHANVSLPEGGIIRMSPKTRWETPQTAPEPDAEKGRSALAYPARGDANRFPTRTGSADLTHFPWGSAHEDFVCGLEAKDHGLGWTAVTRKGEGDLFISLRDVSQLPMTMLWHSNGGRDYAPWSGRHRNCLGVEEGAAFSLLGAAPDPDLQSGGMITLGGKVEIAHVIGVAPWPSEEPVSEIAAHNERLTIRGQNGAETVLNFDHDRLLASGAKSG